MTKQLNVLDSGLIVNESRQIVAYLKDGMLYLPISARQQGSVDDQKLIDKLVATYPKMKYVASLNAEFNPQSQIGKFQNGEKLEGIDLDDTDYDLINIRKALNEKIKKVEEKIKAHFSLPELPYTPVKGLDIKKSFPQATATELEEISNWLNGKGSGREVPYSLRRHRGDKIYLRLHTTAGGNRFIYNSNNYKLPERSFVKLFNEHCLPLWKTNRFSSATNHGGYDVRVYQDRVEIGCQRQMSRSEVERIAKQLGLINAE